jgi:hypothetical protein
LNSSGIRRHGIFKAIHCAKSEIKNISL